jgi:hypothetical protein
MRARDDAGLDEKEVKQVRGILQKWRAKMKKRFRQLTLVLDFPFLL